MRSVVPAACGSDAVFGAQPGLGISIMLALVAQWQLLAPGLASSGWTGALALPPLVCNGAGGALEATQAQTSFNQLPAIVPLGVAAWGPSGSRLGAVGDVGRQLAAQRLGSAGAWI